MDTTDSKWPRNINESLGRTPDTDLRHGFSEHLCSPDAIRGNFEDENFVKIDSPSPNNNYLNTAPDQKQKYEYHP